MKNLIFLLAVLLLSTPAMSALVRGYDFDNNCHLYRAVTANEQGKIVKGDDEIIISTREVYGLSFSDMEVDFNQRQVKVRAMINIVLGLNRQLVSDKVIIEEKNPEFSFLINQLNRKVFLFEKMCLTDDNKVVYAKYFETKEDNKEESIANK